MKPKFFDLICSYLWDVSIERTSSEINPVLDVYLVQGRYQLCTERAIYSFADKYDNFKGVFNQIELPTEGSKVLLLGFGLGAIPFMLEKIFQKSYHYTGVEIDDEIIYLASKYVLDEMSSEVEIISADALAYMELDDQMYDLICMDIFDSDVIPPQFQSIDFLENLKSSLHSNGTLIYNRLYQSSADKEETDTFFKLFKNLFPDGRKLPVSDNMMLINR